MSNNTITINNITISAFEIKEKLSSETLPNWEKEIYLFILNWFNTDYFIVQNTSGSTGTPKKIKLKKSAMEASAKKTVQFFNLKENDTAWLCLPVEYIAGKMMIVRAIVGKLNLIISEPNGTPQIPDTSIDFAALVPLQLQNMIAAGDKFISIKQLIVGGAQVGYTLNQSIQHLPCKVFATYGMTETCSHIAIQGLNGDSPDEDFQIFEGITISVNEQNCLKINAPELLDQEIETTDIVEITSSKSFRWLGRADHIINSGGLKISPEELEKEISELIGVDSIIVPLSDERLGQRIILVVENKIENKHPEELIKQIKTKVGKHRCPKTVYYINEFPRSKAQKINRKEIIKELIINEI